MTGAERLATTPPMQIDRPQSGMAGRNHLVALLVADGWSGCGDTWWAMKRVLRSEHGEYATLWLNPVRTVRRGWFKKSHIYQHSVSQMTPGGCVVVAQSPEFDLLEPGVGSREEHRLIDTLANEGWVRHPTAQHVLCR